MSCVYCLGLSILTQFLWNRAQHFMVDGCRSKLVKVLSEVPQGSVLGRYCSSCTIRSFSILENKVIGYVDCSTFMACAIPRRQSRSIATSLIRDLGSVSEWCDIWRMKLNASKTNTIIVFRSRSMYPQSPPLTIGKTVLKESDDLKYLSIREIIYFFSG